MQIFIDDGRRLGNINANNKTDDSVIATALAVQGMKTGKYYVGIGG